MNHVNTELRDKAITMKKKNPRVPADKIAESLGISKASVTRYLREAGLGKSGVAAVIRKRPTKYVKPKPIESTSRAGMRDCLGDCGKKFYSSDKANIVFCDTCRPIFTRRREVETYRVMLP